MDNSLNIYIQYCRSLTFWRLLKFRDFYIFVLRPRGRGGFETPRSRVKTLAAGRRFLPSKSRETCVGFWHSALHFRHQIHGCACWDCFLLCRLAYVFLRRGEASTFAQALGICFCWDFWRSIFHTRRQYSLGQLFWPDLNRTRDLDSQAVPRLFSRPYLQESKMAPSFVEVLVGQAKGLGSKPSNQVQIRPLVLVETKPKAFTLSWKALQKLFRCLRWL